MAKIYPADPLENSSALKNIRLFQLYELLQAQILEAVFRSFLNEVRSDVHNFCADYLIGCGLEACSLESLHVFRSDVLDLHSDDFVGVELREESAHLLHIFGCDI